MTPTLPIKGLFSRPAFRVRRSAAILCVVFACVGLLRAQDEVSVGNARAGATLSQDGPLRTYQLRTTAELRDHRPPDSQLTVSELPGRATIRTGSLLFDGLYALATTEAQANSVSQISDGAYAHGEPIQIEAFQTGESWRYVWTRDLSYSLHLALAGFDPDRAVHSLLFKASELKASVAGEKRPQIVQDTGSGGSYPVSTDRVVWVLGAHATLQHLAGRARQDFLARVYPVLCGTIEQDRHLVFDPADGLYRGEESFLDWREQTYPGWTRDNVLPIGMSKALSVNVANYLLLTHASEYAGLLQQPGVQARYAGWAAELRTAINRRFFVPESGLYSAYLLSDDGVSDSVQVARYDLLGLSLAILSGVADERQTASILFSYPTGPFGPPVVWPQEKTVPIYHNQAIWPFVTAYWTKAARQAGHVAVVDAGFQSLTRLAAANLSNLENYDFVSGRAQVKEGPRQGPVINSRRQLWSVAGYLSLVQDVVFGLETSWEGVRIRPFVTARMRNETFAGTDRLEWRDFTFQGVRNHVVVELPPVGSLVQGALMVERVELNGVAVGASDYVRAADLRPANEWRVLLAVPGQFAGATLPLRVVDGQEDSALCSPVQPRWEADQGGGIVPEEGRLTLRYNHEDPAHVTFNLYRDGQLCAQGIKTLRWTDPDSGDQASVVHSYRVAAVDTRSGHVSHLTPALAYRHQDQTQIIPAKSLHHRGGELVDEHHFKDWGQPGDELLSPPFRVYHRGTYLVRAEFANGAGPLNTGVTCAVKRLEIQRAGSGEPVAGGYLVMPQSGDWRRFDLSSAVKGELQPGEDYVLRVSEDIWSRNMSHLQSNARYTGSAGGGERGYNFVDIAGLHLLYMGQD